MAQKWADKLKDKNVKEFSLYPHAYTPLAKEEGGMPLPDIETEYDSGDDENAQDTTPNWIKNLSFTIGGVTIGAAAVYGLFIATPAPVEPACTPIVQNAPAPAPAAAAPVVPTSSGPAPTGGGRPVSTSTTSVSTTSASQSPASSAGIP